LVRLGDWRNRLHRFGEAMALLGNDDMNFLSRLKWTLQIHGQDQLAACIAILKFS
jgi:hypothetical protein